MKKAAALAYNSQKNAAPKVVASGRGAIAQAIISKAREFDIPIFANQALVDSLLNLEVDAQIPQELYNSVVEVFIWLSHIEQSAQMSKE